MGRPKKSQQQAETVATLPNNRPSNTPTLTRAIVMALEMLGTEVKTSDVRGWINQKFPSIDVHAPSFDSTLSLKRKMLREGGSPTRPYTPSHRSNIVSTQYDPTLTELMRANELVTAKGGIESIASMIGTIQSLATEMGSFEKLAKCVDALKRLSSINWKEKA